MLKTKDGKAAGKEGKKKELRKEGHGLHSFHGLSPTFPFLVSAAD